MVFLSLQLVHMPYVSPILDRIEMISIIVQFLTLSCGLFLFSDNLENKTSVKIFITTIIMTSHNRAQAERLADEIIFMENSKIVEAAPAETFFKSPKTKAAKTYLSHY